MADPREETVYFTMRKMEEILDAFSDTVSAEKLFTYNIVNKDEIKTLINSVTISIGREMNKYKIPDNTIKTLRDITIKTLDDPLISPDNKIIIMRKFYIICEKIYDIIMKIKFGEASWDTQK